MNISGISAPFPAWAQTQTTASSSPDAPSGTTRVSPPRAATASISPLAQFLSRLQQMQQQDPQRFKEVAAGLAAKLRNAGLRAQSRGDSPRATQLGQLATEFQQAAQSGRMPDLSANDRTELSGSLLGAA